MDLDKLKELSQEGQSKIENQIRKKCNPKKIAEELVDKLNKNATEAAKAGRRFTSASFYTWEQKKLGAGTQKKGPLVDFPNRDEASKVLFGMVQKHVTDENIKLKLDKWDSRYDDGDYSQNNEIVAYVEW